jgi:membrane protease YdiL (CAAX protease family)
MHDTGMNARSLYQPAQFFLIAYGITWLFWFTAAYFSTRRGAEGLLGLLVFLGLCGPFIAALVMFRMSGSPELRDDYRDRLFSLRRINPRMLPLILFLVPAVIIAAIAISVLLGGSPGQFAILPGPSFVTLPGLIGLFAAPALEEAGWRGYGVDSLRSRSTLFVTTLSFGLLWAFWHTPLFFISGFYHNTLLSSGLFTANFYVSAFVLAFIINWVFYRNDRSVIACFLFHLSANVAMSFIPAEPFTKVIITVLLLIVAAVVVVADRKLFFEERWGGIDVLDR